MQAKDCFIELTVYRPENIKPKGPNMTTKVNWKAPKKKLTINDLKVNDSFVFSSNPYRLCRKVDVISPSIHGILFEDSGEVFSPSNADLSAEVLLVEAVVNCEI